MQVLGCVMVSKKKIDQELRDRTVKSFLDLLILSVLTNNPSKSADDLMDRINQRFRVSVSPGILYSLLFHLEQDGLIVRDHIKNENVSKITQKGKEEIDRIEKNKNTVQWVIDQILGE